MTLCANGVRGTHAALKRFYIDNKAFITGNDRNFTLGAWIRTVQQGRRAPKAAEALQMLHDMHEKCTRELLVALEAGLDWLPMILGD
eukprot:11501737-Karenia_brevis.AAC.1